MTQQQLIVNNRRNLLIFAQRHSVCAACKAFGVSKTTYYKVKSQFIQTGTLEHRIRRKPRMPNETALSVKKLLLRLVKEHPTRGSCFYAYKLREQGIYRTQQALWLCLKRFDLNTKYKRLVYLETLQQRNQPVTERTLRSLKRSFSTMIQGQWPGHVVALDTFYAGNLKNVGRIYQITGIDLCSRFGWAKLYLDKSAQSTTDFVETSLIPKFFHNKVTIESVLTDNGTEFINSQFKQLLTDYDIQHHRIPKGKPICNAYCERFQRTILEEFYEITFRKKFYRSLQNLQQDLNKYLVYYNFNRPHFGLIKTGALPIDVLTAKNYVLQQRFQNLVNLTC